VILVVKTTTTIDTIVYFIPSMPSFQGRHHYNNVKANNDFLLTTQVRLLGIWLMVNFWLFNVTISTTGVHTVESDEEVIMN
jgi:hypothetical protein